MNRRRNRERYTPASHRVRATVCELESGAKRAPVGASSRRAPTSPFAGSGNGVRKLGAGAAGRVMTLPHRAHVSNECLQKRCETRRLCRHFLRRVQGPRARRPAGVPPSGASKRGLANSSARRRGVLARALRRPGVVASTIVGDGSLRLPVPDLRRAVRGTAADGRRGGGDAVPVRPPRHGAPPVDVCDRRVDGLWLDAVCPRPARWVLRRALWVRPLTNADRGTTAAAAIDGPTVVQDLRRTRPAS